jgi:hypothetical protein
MGGLDWFFSMSTVWLSNFNCLLSLALFQLFKTGGTGVNTLGHIWWSLAIFMATQVIAGVVRYESKTGPFKILRKEQQIKDANLNGSPTLAVVTPAP